MLGADSHTTQAGGLLMAHTILLGLHAPAQVSDVQIDTRAGKAKTSRCQVQALAVTGDGVTFTRLDEALPLPVLKDSSDVAS